MKIVGRIKGGTIMKKKMIFICGIIACISLIGVGVYASMQTEKSSVQSAAAEFLKRTRGQDGKTPL